MEQKYAGYKEKYKRELLSEDDKLKEQLLLDGWERLNKEHQQIDRELRELYGYRDIAEIFKHPIIDPIVPLISKRRMGIVHLMENAGLLALGVLTAVGIVTVIDWMSEIVMSL